MISVVLLAHNYGKYLSDCLNSIINNNLSLIGEIIIINDKSTDNTKEIVEKYMLVNSKIRYFETNFLSLARSYNFAVSKSNFEFITKVDADDTLEKDFVSSFFNELKKNDYDLIFGDLNLINKSGKLISRKKQKKNYISSYIKYPHGSGTIYKKDLWKRINGFDENLTYQDDYDFWLKLKKLKNIKIGYFSKQGYNYRIHDNNMSRSKFKKNLTKIFVLLRSLV